MVKQTMTLKELLDKAKIKKVLHEISHKVVADDKDPGENEVNLKDARIYKSDIKVGETFNYPPLYYFYFSVMIPGLPSVIGEHGDTVEEARERVSARLREMVNNGAII